MEPSGAPVRVLDAIKALAFIGDLSMGQPIDHSLRTAWLARRLAAAAGLDAAGCATAQCVSLLRWSGCTANAPEVSALLGDDVGGREALLAMQFERLPRLNTIEQLLAAMGPVAQIHCEVSGDIARTLGMGADTEAALRCIFEAFDGSGRPHGLAGDQVPPQVYIVKLAGDLEIFERVYGLTQALTLIARRTGSQYPPALAEPLAAHAEAWLRALADGAVTVADDDAAMQPHTRLEMIADVIDLKLPWMTGFSRQVADASLGCAAQLGLDTVAQQRVYRAALIHGMGRAAVPNALWDTPGPLSPSAWERVRLAPYWTSRAARQIGELSDVAEIASYAYERLDGSGHFRGARREAIPIEGRVVAAAVAWCALRAARPWRVAFSAADAAEHLQREAELGRFDEDVVRALVAPTDRQRVGPRSKPTGVSLSARETEVLRRISLGESNKEVARILGLSPSTVRTHVENAFRKLGSSTRAAATLKAATLGLL